MINKLDIQRVKYKNFVTLLDWPHYLIENYNGLGIELLR